jgi:uncharacterized membrane protein
MNRALLGLALLACALGLFFTGFSTFDFVQHLDRQVHGIHCSFVPGLESTDVSGSSGCHVTLMSPFSSVLRDMVWGGVPISLPGMAVFAFLLAYGLRLWIRDLERDRGAVGFYALACALPVLTSGVMGYISLVTLGAACKLCIGTYVSSGLAFVGALGTFIQSRKPRWDDGEEHQEEWQGGGVGAHLPAFAAGVGFVAAALAAYLVLAPDFSDYVGTCGELADADADDEVLLALGPRGGTPAIEVLDPLCPSCRGLEERLNASDLGARLERRALLFPLDNTCNWMVTSAVHAGACTVSEALLCAGEGRADEVLAWAFEEQESIRLAEEAAEGSAARMVLAQFPELEGCLGGSQVKARLNRSLRWAVANKLPVLTPQLYVEGVKLCDEDTDLGLDFALSELLAMRGQ